MLKKYTVYCGEYAEILKRYKKVSPSYILDKTKFFEMPSMTILSQLEQLVANKQSLGMVSYCKVKEHKEDPIVELLTEFVMIEDIFQVNNKWVQSNQNV